MKKISKLILGALVAFSSSALIAMEAYSPISYGTKSRGMGGVSIATVHGAESGLSNPALLSLVEENEMSVGLTYINADIDYDISNGTLVNSNPDNTFSPYAVFNYKITENLTAGLGASMLTFNNYFEDSDNTSDFIETELEKTRLTIPASYSLNNFSLGASIIYEKVSLKMADDTLNEAYSSTDFGYDIGLAYNFINLGLVLGVDYKSEIEHKVSTDGLDGYINSPSEFGIGLSWKIFNTPHTVGLDYKKIDSSGLWDSSTSGDYDLKDQDIFALGYIYTAETWIARVGYKYVSDLYKNTEEAFVMSFLFPYTSSSNYTLGGSYNFNDKISTDLAIVYSTYENSFDNIDGTSDDVKITNNPLSLSIGINYNF